MKLTSRMSYKVATPRALAEAVNRSMGMNNIILNSINWYVIAVTLPMKLEVTWNMLVLVSSPWRIAVPTPMVPNSLSRFLHLPGSMEHIQSLGVSWQACQMSNTCLWFPQMLETAPLKRFPLYQRKYCPLNNWGRMPCNIVNHVAVYWGVPFNMYNPMTIQARDTIGLQRSPIRAALKNTPISLWVSTWSAVIVIEHTLSCWCL